MQMQIALKHYDQITLIPPQHVTLANCLVKTAIQTTLAEVGQRNALFRICIALTKARRFTELFKIRVAGIFVVVVIMEVVFLRPFAHSIVTPASEQGFGLSGSKFIRCKQPASQPAE